MFSGVCIFMCLYFHVSHNHLFNSFVYMSLSAFFVCVCVLLFQIASVPLHENMAKPRYTHTLTFTWMIRELSCIFLSIPVWLCARLHACEGIYVTMVAMFLDVALGPVRLHVFGAGPDVWSCCFYLVMLLTDVSEKRG